MNDDNVEVSDFAADTPDLVESVAVDYTEQLEKINLMQQYNFVLNLLIVACLFAIFGCHLIHSFWR